MPENKYSNSSKGLKRAIYGSLPRLTKFWKVDFFLRNVHIPLVVLALYLVFFEYFVSSVWSLPEGVNIVFSLRSLKYLMIIIVGSQFIFLVLFRPKKDFEKIKIDKYPLETLSSYDFLLLLLPFARVIQYILANQNILSSFDSLYIIAFFLFFFCALCFRHTYPIWRNCFDSDVDDVGSFFCVYHYKYGFLKLLFQLVYFRKP